MKNLPDGNAVVYCQGAFNTLCGKTAHGLVRHTRRYRVTSVIDSEYAGRDAGDVLESVPNGIALLADLNQALEYAKQSGFPATHFVVGLAPDGGRLSASARNDVLRAVESGLNVDCGLHDYLSEDPEIASAAKKAGVAIRDIRKPPHTRSLHFFTGKIEAVTSFKIAVLGSDSAIGKRTTAWILLNALEKRGLCSEMIGTGQTAWMQGATYGVILDALANDFVTGEIEHAVWSAWQGSHPDVIIIEGQGGIMNPAYPGGFEILAAGRPDAVIFQHAPNRTEYDGFPGYAMRPLSDQIRLVELLCGKPVAAITLNHEGFEPQDVPLVCRTLENTLSLPVYDVLLDHGEPLGDRLTTLIQRRMQS
ncbi:MAG: DUF1611 domain-containing protein [Desulfobacterales bacterium]